MRPTLKKLRLGGCKLNTLCENTSELEHGHGIKELFLRSCSILESGMTPFTHMRLAVLN
jgi:hypothetical protein